MSMTVRLVKTWIELHQLDHRGIPAQLGVFQLADAERRVVHIGYAGGRAPFGLRSAVPEAVAACVELTGTEPRFMRYELTHAYLSRWQELLMVHHHDTGRLPAGNAGDEIEIGRLAPLGSDARGGE
jgi:hypothetical protein